MSVLASDAQKQLPVMVYIHGGSYKNGASNDFGIDTMVARSISAKQPMVVVTINYRSRTMFHCHLCVI